MWLASETRHGTMSEYRMPNLQDPVLIAGGKGKIRIKISHDIFLRQKRTRQVPSFERGACNASVTLNTILALPQLIPTSPTRHYLIGLTSARTLIKNRSDCLINGCYPTYLVLLKIAPSMSNDPTADVHFSPPPSRGGRFAPDQPNVTSVGCGNTPFSRS